MPRANEGLDWPHFPTVEVEPPLEPGHVCDKANTWLLCCR